MAERRGWQALEEAVKEVRARTEFDAVRADTKARAQFAVAKEHMRRIGAVDLVSAVAPLLPGFTLTVIEDFDQAGGTGFPPGIALKGPERSTDGTIEIDTLNVYPLVFKPSIVCVVVWRERRKEHKHGDRNKPPTSGHMIWSRDTSDKNSLARCILEGVEQLNLPNDNLRAVKQALGLTASINSIPPRKWPRDYIP